MVLMKSGHTPPLRDPEFDCLRALIIFSAFILHFNSKFMLSSLAMPFAFIQFRVFTVGGFFFFTAGYMAQKVYLPRAEGAPFKTYQKIFFKGGKIFLLYVSYLFLMFACTQEKIPQTIIAFLIGNNYFGKVLLSFSILFLLTPFILMAQQWKHWGVFCLWLVCCISFLVYNNQWAMNDTLKMVLFDRAMFLYPLFPSLAVYCSGFLLAQLNEGMGGLFKSKSLLAGLCLTLLCTHVVLLKTFPAYIGLVKLRQFFTAWETVTPFLFLGIVRYLVSLQNLSCILLSKPVLLVGRQSLIFYMVTNFFIGVIPLSTGAELSVKMLVFVVIGGVTFILTYLYSRTMDNVGMVNGFKI